MRILVVAPHPDDETLGVGGTLLRRKQEGHEIAWLIMTQMTEEGGYSTQAVQHRLEVISKVSEFYNFDYVSQLSFATTALDTLSRQQLIESVSKVFDEFQPDEVFFPHFSDVHSDHKVTFEVIASASKWFRRSFITRLIAYETLSETEFGLNPVCSFQPNLFVNIQEHLARKIEVLSLYSSEIAPHPFPRSLESVLAQANLRGSASGFLAAEAFQILRERS